MNFRDETTDKIVETETYKSKYESTELQAYIEAIFKPSHEDIDHAIKIVCGATDKPKINGIKGS